MRLFASSSADDCSNRMRTKDVNKSLTDIIVGQERT